MRCRADFVLLKIKVPDCKLWRIREELQIAITTWTERTYHRRRQLPLLNRLTLTEYETIINPTVSLAA